MDTPVRVNGVFLEQRRSPPLSATASGSGSGIGFVPRPRLTALRQLQCFLAFADEVEIDQEVLDDLLDMTGFDESSISDEQFEEHIDLASLFSSADPANVPWSKQQVRFMLGHLKQKGMKSFLDEYVLAQKIPIPNLLLAFGVDLAPELRQKLPPTLMYFLRVALCQELQLREKLPDYNTIDDAIDLIHRSKRIIVLTGAGISVSCGIPDFRSENGIYASLAEYNLDDPQQMFDIGFFKENPQVFYSFAHKIYPSNFAPSPCHRFLKVLEDKGKLLRNYTQNIDTLEHAAGVRQVLNCHGSFATASCLQCRTQVPGTQIEAAVMSKQVPFCTSCPTSAPSPKQKKKKSRKSRGDDDSEDEAEDAVFPPNIIKPDITFFGEKLSDAFDKALEEDRERADLLLVIGTSLKVAPVADMLAHLPHSIPQILINKTPVRHINPDIVLLGNADEVVRHLTFMLDWELPNSKALLEDSESRTLRKRTPNQEFGQPKRVGGSHVWLFTGADGGRWLREFRKQHGLPAEEPDFSDSVSDTDYRAAKKAKTM